MTWSLLAKLASLLTSFLACHELKFVLHCMCRFLNFLESHLHVHVHWLWKYKYQWNELLHSANLCQVRGAWSHTVLSVVTWCGDLKWLLCLVDRLITYGATIFHLTSRSDSQGLSSCANRCTTPASGWVLVQCAMHPLVSAWCGVLSCTCTCTCSWLSWGDRSVMIIEMSSNMATCNYMWIRKHVHFWSFVQLYMHLKLDNGHVHYSYAEEGLLSTRGARLCLAFLGLPSFRCSNHSVEWTQKSISCVNFLWKLGEACS